MKLVFYRALVGAILALAPNVVRADLLNSTINADITFEGQDDNGFYTVDVFTGAINVSSGFSNTYNFFRQDTLAASPRLVITSLGPLTFLSARTPLP